MTISCRHYLTSAVSDLPADVADPDGLLEGLAPGTLVTAVVDVTAPDRQLLVREVEPARMALVERLKRAGITRWWAQEHAAWTERGWIDVEALEGEPMLRPHR